MKSALHYKPHLAVRRNSMKYLDLVELIKEKPTYIKAGVKLLPFGRSFDIHINKKPKTSGSF